MNFTENTAPSNERIRNSRAMEVTIRLAKPSECSTIEKCIKNAFSGYISVMGGRPTAMNTDFEPLVKKRQVYVGIKNKVIAAIMVIIANSDYVLLKNVAVVEQFQNKGVGKELLKFAEAETLRFGKSIIQIYTNARLPRLVEYWSKCGFQETKRVADDGHVIVYMAKNLDSS